MDRARDTRGRWAPGADALTRFSAKCRFEPETGCVVWTGGRTMGRGHCAPYPAFWFEGRRWFGHRWAAKFIHRIDIDGFHVDHCCPALARPNTLCVEHLQGLTPRAHQQLTETRRLFIHLQVGLTNYDDVYGYAPADDPEERIPFYTPPAWFTPSKGPVHDDCPF